MTKRYLSYNHENFDDLGMELFKLGLALSYAERTNRYLVLNNDKYTKNIDIFIKYNYENINLEFEKKSNFNFNIDYNENNLFIDFDDFKDLSYLTPNLISVRTRTLLSLLISNNSNYLNFIYNKINDIMNHFHDYKLENYVCMNVKKDTYINNYYEKAYYRHFNNKKIIVRTDDIEWAQENINFIDKSLILFIESCHNNRFTDFMFMSFFKNYIIDNDNFSWWIAYLSNNEKKIITPNNNYNYYLKDWIKQS